MTGFPFWHQPHVWDVVSDRHKITLSNGNHDIVEKMCACNYLDDYISTNQKFCIFRALSKIMNV